MKNKRNWIIVIVLVAAISLYAAFRTTSKTAPEYFLAEITRGNIRSVVEATGTINAVTTVQVGSQVSGTILHLNADFNTQVRKGQVVAQIDPSIFEGNLLQARADLENSKASLAAARANLEKAKSSAVQMKADYNRTIALVKEGVLSQQQLDLSKANAESADASVSAADAQVTQAKAQVSQRDAAVAVSKTNLDHTTIMAPIDGIVINRSVDIGQTVAASLSAPTLFTIAQDLTKMLVYTKTDESDIGRIRPGQPVIFKVDAFPSETFSGRVQEVRMNATVVQNVVTYDTIIEFDNPERKLFPGMTAYVTIPVASARDVLRIPNAALRFKPDLKQDEILAQYKKYGIETGGRGGAGGGDQTPSNEGAAPSTGKAGETTGGRPKGEQPGGGTETGTASMGGRQRGGQAGTAGEGQTGSGAGGGRQRGGQGGAAGDGQTGSGAGGGNWRGRQAGAGAEGQGAGGAGGGGWRGRQGGADGNGQGGGIGGRQRGGQANGQAAPGAEGASGTPAAGGRSRGGQGGGQASGGAIPAPGMGQRPARQQTVIVWMMNEDKSIRPVQIKIGITDLNVTEIASGDLKEGNQVVIGSATSRAGGPPRLGAQPGGGGQRPR